MAAIRLPSTRNPGVGLRTWVDLGQGLLGRLREASAAQSELHERAMLRREPWLEELLHWSHDGGEWRLHGTRIPPDGRRRSVTRSGWCPRSSLPA